MARPMVAPQRVVEILCCGDGIVTRARLYETAALWIDTVGIQWIVSAGTHAGVATGAATADRQKPERGRAPASSDLARSLSLLHMHPLQRGSCDTSSVRVWTAWALEFLQTLSFLDMKLFLQLLGYALHKANQSPHTLAGKEFYALKSRLLFQWGTPDGYDIQHIRKECWTCDGTGKYQGYTMCRKCWGTGVYSEFWPLLLRYTLGDYSFHIPAGRSYSKPPEDEITIRGHIRHESNGHIATEFNLWLFLLFDRATLKKVWGKSGAFYPKTPFVILARIAYEIRSMERRIERRRQDRYWREQSLRQREQWDTHKGCVRYHDDLPF